MKSLTRIVSAALLCAQLVTLLAVKEAYAAAAPVFPAVVKTKATAFTGADTPGVYKTIYTAGASGGKCVAATLHWNDQGAAHVVTLRITVDSVAVDLISLSTSIGLSSGTLGTPLSFFDPSIFPGLPADGTGGNSMILLGAGDTVSATYTTAVTAGYTVEVLVQCQDF